MSSFGIKLALFTTLLLTLVLSSSLQNDYLFNTERIILAFPGGSIQLSLQTVDAQEEETDETEDEEDEDEDQSDDDNNNEEDDEGEDDRQTDSIGICCTWDERLADGILTYRIIERVDEDDDEDDD